MAHNLRLHAIQLYLQSDRHLKQLKALKQMLRVELQLRLVRLTLQKYSQLEIS